MLDQAVMIALCKHIKVTGGNNTLSVEALWDRLMDLIDWAESKPISAAHTSSEGRTYAQDWGDADYMFPCPCYEVFFEAITRLLEAGLLRDAITSNQGRTWSVSENIVRYIMASSHPIRYDASYIIRLSNMIGCPMEYGDVVGALRSRTFMVEFVD